MSLIAGQESVCLHSHHLCSPTFLPFKELEGSAEHLCWARTCARHIYIPFSFYSGGTCSCFCPELCLTRFL